MHDKRYYPKYMNNSSRSVQFSRSIKTYSLQPHRLQHTRLPCPQQTPRACSNSCPLSWCGHPPITSSVVPFSSCLQSFPRSGSYPRSKFFTSSGQSIGSFSLNISSNEHSGLISFRIDWFDLLAFQELSRVLQHHSSKASIFQNSALFIVQLSHPYMTTGKTIALTRQSSVSKVMSLLFNMMSRLVIPFLSRSSLKDVVLCKSILCVNYYVPDDFVRLAKAGTGADWGPWDALLQIYLGKMTRTGIVMDQGVLGDSKTLLVLWDGWSCSSCMLVSPRKYPTHQGNALMGQLEPVWLVIPWLYRARALLAGWMKLDWVLGGLSARVSHGVEQTETALGNHLKCRCCVTIHAIMGKS